MPFNDLAADVALAALQDWGRPVRLVTTDWTYDPLTGEQTRTIVDDQDRVGILSQTESRPTPGTAGGERRRDTLLLMRADDYGPPVITGRAIVIDLQWYDVVHLEQRTGGLVALTLVTALPAGVSGVAA